MATTINSYSVGLGLDASEYIKNSKLSRSETNQLKRDIKAARTPAENYEHSITKLEKALREGAIEQRTFNRLVDDARSKMARAEKAAKSQAFSLGSIKTAMIGISAAYVSVDAAFSTARWAVKLAADAEQAQIAFEVLVKDVDKAELLIGKLRGFAAATPFQTDEVLAAGKSLLAFGFTADQIQQRLLTLGNISAATGSRLGELAEVVGKMRVQGRIMSEDLNQLAGRGINVFDGLAERLGITTDKVKEFASEGKIQFADLQAVLDDLAANDFGGMMERQSDSIAGRWSTVTSNINQAGAELGEFMLNLGKAGEGMGFLEGLAKRFADGMSLLNDPGQIIERQGEESRIAMELEAMRKQREQGGSIKDLAFVRERTDKAMEEAEAKREAMEAEQQQGEAIEKNTSLLREREQLQKELARLNGEFDDLSQKPLEDIANADERINEGLRRQIDAHKKINQEQEKQTRLKQQMEQAEMRLAETVERIAEEQAERKRKMFEDVAAGPGSGDISQLASFQSQQRNAEIAAKAMANSGDIKVTDDQQERANKAAEEVAKLRQQQSESQAEQRKQTAILNRIAEAPKPARVR